MAARLSVWHLGPQGPWTCAEPALNPPSLPSLLEGCLNDVGSLTLSSSGGRDCCPGANCWSPYVIDTVFLNIGVRKQIHRYMETESLKDSHLNQEPMAVLQVACICSPWIGRNLNLIRRAPFLIQPRKLGIESTPR